MPEIKVTYFNLRVRGEPIRLLLAYGDLPYEDIRPLPPWEDKEGWAKMKTTLPYGQLPKLDWDGQSIFTCLAGCRFIAHHLDLMGKTKMEHAQVDEIVDVIEDTLNAGYRAILTQDPAEKEKLMETHKTKTIPAMLENMEKRLVERGGQFYVGNQMTWADIQMYFFYTENINDDIKMTIPPKISDLVRRIGDLPNIKKWVATRPVTPY